MAQSSVTRKLAAIVSADVAGYSRLVETDEAGTIASLTAHHNELIEPAVTEHGGRIVKTTGDGWLIEFPSIVAGLECAVTLQQGMAERNAHLPATRAMRLRIGVNLGDVIVENGDIYGEGVNLAARLEGLAEPGDIVVSQMAYDQLRSRVAVGYQDLGERPIKNISEPVRAYRVLIDPAAAGAAIGEIKPRRGTLKWSAVAGLAALALAVIGTGTWLMLAPTPDDPFAGPADIVAARGSSLAVLPFRGATDDAAMRGLRQAVVDGLAASAPGPVRAAEAAGDDSSPEALQALGDKLEARYLLTGEFDHSAAGSGLVARLFDTATRHEIWSRRYDTAAIGDAKLADAIVNDLTALLGSPQFNSVPSAEEQGPAANPAEGSDQPEHDIFVPRESTEGGP